MASLPEEVKALLHVLARNKISPSRICPETIGRSAKEPIILEGVRDCVRMEYLVIDHILEHAPFKVLVHTLYDMHEEVCDPIVVETHCDNYGTNMLDFYFDISFH